MGQVKVVLKSKVKNLGNPLDICDVKRGYAFNFLIPQGIAVMADEIEYKRALDARAKLANLKTDLTAKAKDIVGSLESKQLSFEMKATPKGKLYGSIGTKDILDKLSAEHKIDLLEDMLKLEEPIKTLGEHSVKVMITDEVVTEIKLVITKA